MTGGRTVDAFYFKIRITLPQEPSQADPGDTNNLEAHFAKLNLDQEELIVMESCHSYIHDLLRWYSRFVSVFIPIFISRQLGPTNAMDPILQQEINGFPPEAKVICQFSLSRFVQHHSFWFVLKFSFGFVVIRFLFAANYPESRGLQKFHTSVEGLGSCG